jgi:predicted RNA binding protein YcfA (HicA-like mRNA interferase family)
VPASIRLDHHRLEQMKFREIIAIITADGWYLARTRGSHRIYKHEVKQGTVTIAGQPNEDVRPGTKISILKQAGLR